MPPDISVTPSNSPYVVPSPTATYGHVTIHPGGFLTFPQPTTLTCDTLEKSVAVVN